MRLLSRFLNHLLGQINFALFVHPDDKVMKEYFNIVKTIMKNQNDNNANTYTWSLNYFNRSFLLYQLVLMIAKMIALTPMTKKQVL